MKDPKKKPAKRVTPLKRNLPQAELLLWRALRRRQLDGVKFRRQFPVEPHIADFACIEQRLIIELDGATPMKDADVAKDPRRIDFFEDWGWRVYQVKNADVLKDLPAVLAGIRTVLEPS